jgi:hypothetical protein
MLMCSFNFAYTSKKKKKKNSRKSYDKMHIPQLCSKETFNNTRKSADIIIIIFHGARLTREWSDPTCRNLP